MWFVYLLIWLTVAVGFQALAQVLALAACREELQEEAGKEQQAEEKYVCTETWDGYRGCFCLCDFFFSFKKHPILNKNCRVRLQLEKSAKQKALRSRELELATPRHLCTSLWETGNAQLGTELCLDFAALWESKEMAIRKSRKASRSPASQQTFSICKSMIERVCHTLEKDGLCRGKLVRELHCWEWNSSLSQMELSLFTSLNCDIHSVHLADAEGKSFQQISSKYHSASACFSSLHINQHII